MFFYIRVIAVVFDAGAIYKSVLSVITCKTVRENTHSRTKKQQPIHITPNTFIYMLILYVPAVIAIHTMHTLCTYIYL